MSKNITIEEGSQGRNFTARKLQTQTTSGGMATWIPEDEAADYISTASKTVNENGEFSAEDDGVDAYSDVDVEVLPNLQTKKVIRANGEYNAEDEGVDGYASVQIVVPTSSGGGGGGGKKAKLITKSITQNGTYRAKSDGADGYSSVIVNVSEGGGDYYYPWENHLAKDKYLPGVFANTVCWCEYNGQFLVFSNFWGRGIYSVTENSIEKISDDGGFTNHSAQTVEFHGKVHKYGGIFGSDGKLHWSWDGNEWKKDEEALPYRYGARGTGIIYDGRIHILGCAQPNSGTDAYGNATKHYSYGGGKWEEESEIPFNFFDGSMCIHNGEIHIIGSYIVSADDYRHFKYNGNWEEVSTPPAGAGSDGLIICSYNKELHLFARPYFHYVWNGLFWRIEEFVPYDSPGDGGMVMVMNGKLYCIGGGQVSYSPIGFVSTQKKTTKVNYWP